MKIVKYFLITDPCVENANPGDHLISKGIQYLLQEVEKQRGNFPIFNTINIFSYNKESWERMYEEADYLIVCGTPQLSFKPEESHIKNLWLPIQKAKEKGIICANLWCGSGYPDSQYTFDKSVSRLYEKNKKILKKYFGMFDLIIVRDAITKAVLEKAGLTCNQLIDSVFFSADFYNIKKQVNKWNIIVPRYCPRNSQLISQTLIKYSKFLDNKIPTYFLCHSIRDYLQYKNFMPFNLLCINTPKNLLSFYSFANQVISMRVHGSVPSINFDKKVINICTDSRSNILEYVGLKSTTWRKLDKKTSFFCKNIQYIKERSKAMFLELYNKNCLIKNNK